MSRSGYTDDCENVGLYRHAVMRAILGKRGQALLRDMLAGLDALPEKRLVAGVLRSERGEVCALGAAGVRRNIDMTGMVTPWDDGEEEMDVRRVAAAFDVAESLAREVAYINEEANWKPETPEERYTRVRAWVVAHIVPTSAPSSAESGGKE